MTRWFVAACFVLAVVPACAPLKTEMVECPASGCRAPEPVDPILSAALPKVQGRAAVDLACPPEAIAIDYIGPQSEYAEPGFGPFEAKGCGKQTIYKTVDVGWGGWDVQRTSVVVPVAK